MPETYVITDEALTRIPGGMPAFTLGALLHRLKSEGLAEYLPSSRCWSITGRGVNEIKSALAAARA